MGSGSVWDDLIGVDFAGIGWLDPDFGCRISDFGFDGVGNG